MSNLASLLNPAPSSDSKTSATVTNGTAHHQHSRHPSLTSPLEALAIAATSTSPVLSPTSSNAAPLVSTSGHRQSFSSSISRPNSSHISLPVPHALAYPTISVPIDHHSPTHHHIGARRLSGFANQTSSELPPIRQAQPEDMVSSATTSSRDASTADSQQPLTHNPIQQLPPVHQTVDMVADDTRSGSENPPVDCEHNTDAIAKTGVTGIEGFQVYSSGGLVSTQPKLHGQGELPPIRNGSLTPMVEVVMKREDSTQSLALGSAPMADDQPSIQATHPAAKKRPAPKVEKKVEKKGIASAIKKPTAKKRKLDADSMDGTPSSQRSGTPASSRASKTPVPRNRKQSSATPLHSSPAPGHKEVEDDDDEDIDDDSELFCICRKPDDHTWMIGCDGGCEDWFHGRCVKMNERDGNLIDKYICELRKLRDLGS